MASKIKTFYEYLKPYLFKALILSIAGIPYPYLNIAADGAVTQSSTGWNGVPARAIDGDHSGKYSELVEPVSIAFKSAIHLSMCAIVKRL